MGGLVQEQGYKIKKRELTIVYFWQQKETKSTNQAGVIYSVECKSQACWLTPEIIAEGTTKSSRAAWVKSETLSQKITSEQTGEMAQSLTACAGLPEDPRSAPSNQGGLTAAASSSSRWPNSLFWPKKVPHTYTEIQTYIHTQQNCSFLKRKKERNVNYFPGKHWWYLLLSILSARHSARKVVSINHPR